jgi:hypothetical protein
MARDRLPQDFHRKNGQLVARVWADPAFKARLLADPTAVLKEQGVEVPPGVEVRIAEDTDQVVNLVLPQKPAEAELSEEELAQVCGAGGRGGLGGEV